MTIRHKSILEYILGSTILVMLFLLCIRGCFPSPLTTTTTSHSDTVTRIDTFKSPAIVETLETIKETHKVDTFSKVDTFFAKVDTSAIIAHFLNDFVTYQKTYKDSLYSITLIDTIHQNQLFGRSLAVETYHRTQTITNTTRNFPKWSIYGGASVSQHGIAPSMLLTKSNHAIGAGYHLGFSGQNHLQFTYLFNIKTKYP